MLAIGTPQSARRDCHVLLYVLTHARLDHNKSPSRLEPNDPVKEGTYVETMVP